MNIRSIFRWFSAGSESASKVLDAGIRGIDALVLTDEEKLNMHKALGEQWIELQKTLGPETTIRAVTRRILSVAIMGGYLLFILAAAVAYPFSPEYTNLLLSIVDGYFGLMAIGVAGFYFGPYMVGQFMNKKKE